MADIELKPDLIINNFTSIFCVVKRRTLLLTAEKASKISEFVFYQNQILKKPTFKYISIKKMLRLLYNQYFLAWQAKHGWMGTRIIISRLILWLVPSNPSNTNLWKSSQNCTQYTQIYIILNISKVFWILFRIFMLQKLRDLFWNLFII